MQASGYVHHFYQALDQSYPGFIVDLLNLVIQFYTALLFFIHRFLDTLVGKTLLAVWVLRWCAQGFLHPPSSLTKWCPPLASRASSDLSL